MTQDKDDLPPAPEPAIEPREPSPGGPHAVEGVGGDGPTSTVGRDLPPDLNPVGDQLPEKTKTTEDTDTEATKGNPEPPPEQESPA